MDRRKWRAAAAVVIVALVGAPRRASAHGGTGEGESAATIAVRVDDKTGVQGALLKLAEARASEVFAMSGVRIVWIDGKEASRLNLAVPYTILIMPEAPTQLKARDAHGTDVMGQGAPFIGRAYVYYDRVSTVLIAPRDIVTMLGDVMAHELGHLVLPPGHSSVGIMQPSINMTSRRVETFTQAETEAIHARLLERDNR
jgi:hypothetical protein